MNRLILLGSLALATGCSPETGSEIAPGASYATQLTAPSPDYASMERIQPDLDAVEIERKASEPPPEDAHALGQLWFDRLDADGHLGGAALAGKGPDGAIVHLDVLLTAEQFDAWVASYGADFPRHIDLRFQNPLVAPQVSRAAGERIRYWPASERRTGMQNMAALGGRIVASDGCFYYIGWDNPDGDLNTLAWFLNETGLDLDDEGYLVLVNRNTGELEARLGEEMGWAGPNGVVIADEQKVALFEACGEHEIVSVGNPQAREKTYAQYPHLREPSSPPPPAPNG